MRTPAALVAIPLLAGATAPFVVDCGSPTPLIAALTALLALLSATASFLNEQSQEATCAIVVGSLLAGFSLGLTAVDRAYRPPLLGWFATVDAANPIVLEGTLRDDAVRTDFGAA